MDLMMMKILIIPLLPSLLSFQRISIRLRSPLSLPVKKGVGKDLVTGWLVILMVVYTLTSVMQIVLRNHSQNCLSVKALKIIQYASLDAKIA